MAKNKQVIFNTYVVDIETGKVRWFPNIPYEIINEDEKSFYLAPQNGVKCGIHKSLEGDLYELV